MSCGSRREEILLYDPDKKKAGQLRTYRNVSKLSAQAEPLAEQCSSNKACNIGHPPAKTELMLFPIIATDGKEAESSLQILFFLGRHL